MTGASLGYDGIYGETKLLNVGIDARWHSSTVSATSYTRFLSVGHDGLIYASDQGNKHLGRSVR